MKAHPGCGYCTEMRLCKKFQFYIDLQKYLCFYVDGVGRQKLCKPISDYVHRILKITFG